MSGSTPNFMMMKMKKITLLLLLFSVFAVGSPGAPARGQTDDPRAREIMRKVEGRDKGDDMIARMEMTLIDKNNKARVRKLKVFSKDKGEDTYNLMFFVHPADVKDTGFLNIDYDDPDVDDDQWLYLPALKKAKRIAVRDKSGSFMGSDLNYADMTSRDLEDFDFSFYKTPQTSVNGHECWLITAVPRSEKIAEETGYREVLLFVRQDNYFVIRSVSWEERGDYVKFMAVKRLEQIDRVWFATEIHVVRKKGRVPVHKTELRFHDVRFNQALSYDMFTLRRLEKGL